MASAKETLIQSAVVLLATGKARSTTQAVFMAQELVLEVERLLEGAPSRSTAIALQKAVARVAAQPAKGKAAAKPARATKAPPASRAAAKPPAGRATKLLLGARARKVFERLGLVRPDEAELLPRQLRGKICVAHLDGAKACGPATIKQIAAWFEAHGESLVEECALFDANWLTNRCDEAAER